MSDSTKISMIKSFKINVEYYYISHILWDIQLKTIFWHENNQEKWM